MIFKFKEAAVAIVAAGLVASFAYATDAAPPAKKHVVTKKAKTPPPPTVEEQIQSLRDALNSQAAQIDGLKAGMAQKDAQLQKAEQEAAEAKAAATRAQAEATASQQALTQNSAAVSTLQTTLNGVKGNQASLAATVSDETTKIKKAMDSPTALRYKGITLAPYGFFNGELSYRTHATGGEESTPWSSIPYEHADSYALSEMALSGRQSRIGLNMEGKVRWGTLRAYLEGDFLGVGTTSNANQSTSYVFRQRVA